MLSVHARREKVRGRERGVIADSFLSAMSLSLRYQNDGKSGEHFPHQLALATTGGSVGVHAKSPRVASAW
jgi:hypothetical protein